MRRIREEKEETEPKNKYQDFILGSPIPDPTELTDEAFKEQLIIWFYKVIRIHSKYLYHENSDLIIEKILTKDIRPGAKYFT